MPEYKDGKMKVDPEARNYLYYLGLPVTDTNVMQLQVFSEALKTFHSRDAKYGGLWEQYPAEMHAMHCQSKLSRMQVIQDEDLDDAVDLLNYAAFFIRTKRSPL